jgi:hypothetical protein
MSMRDIFGKFSWDTLMGLPPSELLSLMLIPVLLILLVVAMLAVWNWL